MHTQAILEHCASGGRRVPLEVFLPSAPATAPRCPAVLVLHGSFGLPPQYRDDIVSFAQALAAHGIAAVLPHYLEATATVPGTAMLPLIAEMQPVWRGIAADTLAWMAADPRFDKAHCGLLGFSLGANLALAVAMNPPAGPRPRCVVDFFGPLQGLPAHWARLPPVLIHHGSADTVVPAAESARLVALLAAAGRQAGSGYQLCSYPGQGHGFQGTALAQSRDTTVQFIQRAI